ncbi:MAG: GWxTD domain-containing protein [Gemmatimonadota bacterium]
MTKATSRTIGSLGSALLLAATIAAVDLPAQTMPGEVYHALSRDGHEDLADHVRKKLDMREDPDEPDVREIVERWEAEAGGPGSGWDWVTVARLWIRAGSPARAELALAEADETGEVPAAVLLLDQARIAFLGGDIRLGEQAYWQGCERADDGAALQYWRDIEILATPEELERWDRFRRLPAGQTDLCALLRRFWAERAMASTTSIGARIRAHYERVQYAQNNYRRRSGKKGPTLSTEVGRPREAAYDDRGLIYIRMGEPARTTRFAGNPTSMDNEIVSAECYQPNESWAYDYPEGTRVYHFTTFSGTDDYWLIENLGQVYRCGAPEASGQGGGVMRLSPVNQHRAVQLGPAASLVLQDLYRSRQGLDPLYAQAAQRMSSRRDDGLLNTQGTRALESERVLQEERDRTFRDVRFAIRDVPERPTIDPDSRLMVETLQFRSRSRGKNRVWVSALLEGDRLTPRPEGTAFRYRVDARLALVGENGEYETHDASFAARSPTRLGRDQSVPVRIPLELDPGEYRYTLTLRDGQAEPGARPSGNYRRGSVTVRDLAGRLPVLSDVAVASDSAGSWQPQAPSGPDLGMVPGPAHRTGPGGVAWIYFEAYNLTPGGRYETRVRFEPAGDGEAFDLSFSGEVPFEGQPRTRRVLRLDLADAEPGNYETSVTVTDEESGDVTLPHTTSIVVTGEG